MLLRSHNYTKRFLWKLVFPESDLLAEAVFEIDDSKYSELQKKKPTDLAARWALIFHYLVRILYVYV